MKNKILQGDCIEVMKDMKENSIDTIITDSPYGLKFMGKAWDKFRATRQTKSQVVKNLGAGMRKQTRDEMYGFQEWTTKWATEALRVAKPGATLLCFGGTRTWHRMACAIEDAGWEIRDTIAWMYGSGFPKSLDISKQLDKGHKREVIGKMSDIHPRYKTPRKGAEGYGNIISSKEDPNLTAPTTPEAKLWNGYGTALKPAFEPIILAMKPKGEPALDIFQAVCYTLNKNGFNKILWKEKPVKNVKKQRTLKSSTRTKLPRMEEISVVSVKKSEMQSQEKNIEKAYLRNNEQDTKKIQKNSENITENNKENLENKYSKNMEEGVSVVEKHMRSSLPSTTLTEKGNNTEIKSVKHVSMRTYGEEDSPKIITDYCATTAITLLDVTDTALTIIFEDKEYIIEILPDGSFVYPKDLPKYRKARPLTYAQNALKHGVAGLNIDGGRIEAKPRKTGTKNPMAKSGSGNCYLGSDGKKQMEYDLQNKGRFPANLILDEEAGKMLDEQSGVSKSSGGKIGGGYAFGKEKSIEIKGDPGFGDKGGASRFFYCAKSSKAERNAGLEEFEKKIDCDRNPKLDSANVPMNRSNNPKVNSHPTVKPLSLMRYLCNLTKTPTGGIILDPFAGSGSTLIAAIQTGRDYIGIEKEEEYIKIAEARIKYWQDKEAEKLL